MAPTITAAAPEPNAIVLTPNRAYVTFLPRGGNDVHGIVGLVKGLRKVESRYPLVVAVLPEVPEKDHKTLEEQGCIVRVIQPVDLPENQTQFAKDYNAINYSKLRIWEFVEYSKMIYLNSNIQVYNNIDHLFDRPNGRFHAVEDCFCEKTWSRTPQYKIGYCQQCPDRVPWPKAERGPCPAPYFNAGMFVFEPGLPQYTFRDLLETLNDTPPTPFADQDFLNKCFQDIYSPIDPFHNLVLPMLWRHPEKIGLNNVMQQTRARGRENMGRLMENWFEKVKAVQYCAPGSKPWSYNENEENMDREEIKMLVNKWFDIYNNVTLDYRKSAAPVAGGGAGEPAVVPGGGGGEPAAVPGGGTGGPAVVPGGGGGEPAAVPGGGAGGPAVVPGGGAGEPAAVPGGLPQRQ